MALSQKHRIALYECFVPQVGDEVTEALLAEFPARDGDELVTKEHLRAELADVHKEFAVVRKEMADGFAAADRRMTTLFVATIATQLTALGLATTVVLAVLG